jgi:hypothetical protein
VGGHGWAGAAGPDAELGGRQLRSVLASTPTSTTCTARPAPWAGAATWARRAGCRGAACEDRATRSPRWADP